MQIHRRVIPIVLVLLMASTRARAETKYLTGDDVAAIVAIVPAPPEMETPEQEADIKTLLELQAKRTPEDIVRAEKNSHLTGFLFADVLGGWFNSKDLPLTAGLMSDIHRETDEVVNPAKAKYHRERPFIADTRIRNTLKIKGFSYPSGHSTTGMTFALILAEMFPEQRDALIEKGKEIGHDREVAGVHYPSDVEEGRKVAAEIAKRLLANPEFHAAMEKAIEEVHADAQATK